MELGLYTFADVGPEIDPARRPPEVEAIAGPILRSGSEHGIEVSATRALVDRILALR